jgi:hypothetical protein
MNDMTPFPPVPEYLPLEPQSLEARRTTNDVLIGWCSRLDSLKSPLANDIWELYWEVVRPHRDTLQPNRLTVRCHPSWRERLAIAFVRTAIARVELDPFPFAEDIAEEVFIWEAARACSSHIITMWNADLWTAPPIGTYSYQSSLHRLADLYRRSGRTDYTAVTLFVELYTGPTAFYYSTHGPGGHYTPAALIEQGVSVKAADALTPFELRRRYGLCLRLLTRQSGAAWVKESIEVAQGTLPDASTRSQALAATANFEVAAKYLHRKQVESRAASPDAVPLPPPEETVEPSLKRLNEQFSEPYSLASLAGDLPIDVPSTPKRRKKRSTAANQDTPVKETKIASSSVKKRAKRTDS